MTIAVRDVAHRCWATGPAVLRRIALALLVNDPEFGNCRRAAPDDPPADLTLPPETSGWFPAVQSIGRR
jgi:hypothetical protein